MPAEDANRWNLRYQTDLRNSSDQARTLLLDHVDLLPNQGLALDLAMGLGGNASFLLRHGLRVIGVDISLVAVRRTRKKFPTLMTIVADLEQFQIPTNTFDVILNFLYLQRNLWPSIINGLKIGGVLFMECLTEDMLVIHPDLNPAYLLQPTELQQVFNNSELGKSLEILYYFEGWRSTRTSHPRATASLIARRTA